jgi:hypothetical protein
MTEQQTQNIIAFLELARTAIDNAELRLAGLTDGERAGFTLVKVMSEIAAAAHNLTRVGEVVKAYAELIAEDAQNAATVDRSATGESLAAKQKG